MSNLCLFADPDIGLSASHIYHVVQNACWREYKTADELHVLLASAICKFIAKCICLNCKMYLFKLQNVFVQIAKCICSNCKVYLSFYTYHACWGEYETKQLVLLNMKQRRKQLVLLASAICKLLNVFVQITKCICSNYIVYLSKLQSVFVQIEKYTYHAC